ncbi:hypothetical protein KKG31_07835 [Patescibacteria group bacterium]|nr:hypothetical protein [Patescibacteria group bacterium]MBU1758976.1 hypothetical protein [Patescibacteria group bacterium]
MAQIFFEDMDDDGNLDIITNDNRNDIKIFYGGADNDDDGYYISKLTYTCDDERYDRQIDNTQTVRSLGIEIDKDRYIQNESLIRREGLLMPVEDQTQDIEDTTPDPSPFNANLDGWDDAKKAEGKDKKDKDELEQLQDQADAMVNS